MDEDEVIDKESDAAKEETILALRVGNGENRHFTARQSFAGSVC
jgi:hypothetical protein